MRATSIIPLEKMAPSAIPILAKIMILRNEIAFDPMAEFKKLTASLLTPTIKSPMLIQPVIAQYKNIDSPCFSYAVNLLVFIVLSRLELNIISQSNRSIKVV